MAIESRNPANGELIQSFTALSTDEVEAKIELAAATWTSYRKSSFAWRAERLQRAAEILEAEKERFGRLMTLEMGKPIQSAIDEVVKCAWACRYYAENAEQFLADELIATSAQKSYLSYQPLGIILSIMPWNFPFWQVFRFAAPALMAGNVGLLKHASNVPQSALAIEEILTRAGFEAGCFQTLLIGASQVDAIIEDPRVKAVTLTGSEGAGVQVGMSAAKRIKKVVLELGGSDPFIVTPTADVDEALTWAVKARCLNNGQSCIAAKRFIVHRSIAEKFTAGYVAKMAALKIGDPLNPATEIGPLSYPAAAEEIERDVQASIAAGAKCLLGGMRLPIAGGAFFAPTVLTEIPESAPAYREEFFGPVASIFVYESVEQAIEIANATRFGLGSSVWTNDAAEREAFIRGIEAGMVFVNKMVVSDPRMPFGGAKASGIGREMGHLGIRELTNIKSVWIEK